MACSERLPTRLNPLAEWTCFPQVDEVTSILEGFMGDTGNACEYVDAVLKPVLGEKFAAYTIQVTFSVRGPLCFLFRRRVV